jgi:hypothetical protein
MKLVDDARRAWRWISVHCMAWAIAVQGAWEVVPPEMRSGIPPRAVTAITVALLVLGIVGRLVKQGDKP